MTSSLSFNNNKTHNNINNKSNSNMANSKMYNKNSKKIDEVREVIQNKPETDIIKVLEYFDNDVGKTIDAFINDGGKEAIQKWNEIKSAKKIQNINKKKQNGTNEPSDLNEDVESNNNNVSRNKQRSPRRNLNDNNEDLVKQEKKDNNNNISNNNNKKNKHNHLNDLVASIINQYTGSGSSETPEPIQQQVIKTPAVSNVTIPLIQPPQNQQQQNLLENLNNLVNSSQTASLSKALSGLKVTVLGIEQANTMKYETNKTMSPVISSVSSSPSSMSVVSSMSLSSSSDKQPPQQPNSVRPSLLELNKKITTPVFQKQFNTSYTNPNSKNVLEKSNKDLQRQTVALNKISSKFQEDLTKSQNSLNKTFNHLRQLLNERQNQLQFKFNSLAQIGNDILTQRQTKAAELKHLAENAIHLNDNETLELKADIKHFLSERQLDEELTRIKFFQEENLDSLCSSINSFGTIAQLKDQYSTERPPLNELLNSAILNNSLPPPLPPLPCAAQLLNSLKNLATSKQHSLSSLTNIDLVDNRAVDLVENSKKSFFNIDFFNRNKEKKVVPKSDIKQIFNEQQENGQQSNSNISCISFGLLDHIKVSNDSDIENAVYSIQPESSTDLKKKGMNNSSSTTDSDSDDSDSDSSSGPIKFKIQIKPMSEIVDMKKQKNDEVLREISKNLQLIKPSDKLNKQAKNIYYYNYGTSNQLKNSIPEMG